MAKVSFYKLTNANLNSLSIKEGQVIFVTDTKRLYLDDAQNSRIEMTSYNLTQDASDNHILVFTRPDGTTSQYTIPDHIYTSTGHIEIDENNVIALDEDTTEFFDGESYITKTDNNLYLTDVYAENINELRIEGKSEQVTTNGNQLLDLENIATSSSYVTTEFEKDVLTITSRGSSYCAATVDLLSFFQANVGKTIKWTSGEVDTSEIGEGAAYNVTLAMVKNGSNVYHAFLSTPTYTIPDDIADYTAVRFNIFQNNTGSAHPGTVRVTKPLLSFADQDTYEPYTGQEPSPNTSYPQEIETLIGYRNLFNKENINSMCVQRYISNVGNLTYSNTSLFCVAFPCKPNSVYTISHNVEVSFFRCGYTTENWAAISGQESIALKNWFYLDGDNRSHTIETGDNATYVLLQSPVALKDDVVESLQFVEKAPVLPYVPYGNNYLYIKSTGKNIFNKDFGTLTYNISNGWASTFGYIPVKAEKQITLSGVLGPTGYNIYFYWFDKDCKVLSTDKTAVIIPATAAVTVTVPENCCYTKIRTSLNGETADVSTWQLEYGNQKTTYESYKEYSDLIPLNNNELCEIGDCKDELIIDNTGNCYLNKKIGKVVLDENSTGFSAARTKDNSIYFEYAGTTIFKNIAVSSLPNGKCNYLLPQTANTLYSSDTQGFTFTSSTGKLRFNLLKTIASDTTSLSTWLATHNLIVYGERQNYELIDLNYRVKNFKLFQNITNITNGNTAEMFIKYYNKSIDGLYNSLSDKIGNINYIDMEEKGSPNGVAELDENGILLTSQMPSYVDDVLEYASLSAFPGTGESGKIYVALDTNLTYRWSGTTYTEISKSLALGTTSSTAYRGDRGNAAYTHAVTNKGIAATSGFYKFASNSQGHISETTPVAKTDITGLGIPGSAADGVKIDENVIKLDDEAYHILYDDAEKTTELSNNININDALESKAKNAELSKLSTQNTNILPEGYTQVEYVASSGAQRIDTGVIIDDTIGYDITMMCLGEGGMYGRYTTSPSYKVIAQRQGSQLTIGYGTASDNTAASRYLVTDLSIVEGKTNYKLIDKKLYINDELITTFTQSVSNSWNEPFYLFTQSSVFGRGRIYRAKVYKGGILVRDMIPCFRNSDNEIGMYDLCYNTFYANDQDGDPFTKGDNYITIPSPDYPVEIKTVKGFRNLFDKDNFNVVDNLVVNYNNPIYSSSTVAAKTLYINIEPNKEYTIFKTSGSVFRVATSEMIPAVGVSVNSARRQDNANFLIIKSQQNDRYLGVTYFNNEETLTEQEILNSIMIVEGYIKTAYKPYGNNYLQVRITGENLLDKTKWVNGNILSDGTENDSTLMAKSNFYIPVKSNTNYIFSFNTSLSSIRLAEYSEDKKFIVRKDASVTSSLTITTGSTTKYVRWTINYNNTTSVTQEILNSLAGQLEEGTLRTTYKEYKEKILEIPLNNNELCGIGNYRDKLLIDRDGHCYLNKNIGKIVLTGSETSGWYYNTSSSTPFCFNTSNVVSPPNNNTAPSLLCNYYKVNAWNNAAEYDWRISMTQSEQMFRFKNPDIPDLATFKTWLSTHNTEIYYALATSQLIDLNTTVSFELFKGINNISENENTDMQISYANDSIKGMYEQLMDITGLIGNDLDIINGEEV